MAACTPGQVEATDTGVITPTSTLDGAVTIGPHDREAQIRLDLITLQPDRVTAGDLVSVFFPDERTRGIHFVLESRHGNDWNLDYHLISDWGEGREPAGYRADAMEGFDVEDIGIGGAGPDVVRIPADVAPGEYRLCTGNSRPNICALLAVDASA